MGNIVLLDELTINKIAAGEVIERPSSVIKEMVENSIDAGASNITVEIKNGGISYIRITDNGKGIASDDMEISFERHATSKIRIAEDLNKVKSMGFRGEALASIAAIANVEMISRSKDEEIGNRIVVEGGRILQKQEIGCPIGTTITVQNLFFNTPVRYKFLKRDFTEAGYIEDTITRLALINPNISFKLINSGKVIVQTLGNGNQKDVVYNIFGRDVAEAILIIDNEYEGMHLTGVVGKPEIARSNRTNQLFFVNKRFVKDRILSSATDQAFKGLLPIGKNGFVILNIDMNPEKVDVNVHPAKLEVRFEEENKVFKAVYHSVHDTLLKGELIANTQVEESNEQKEEIFQKEILSNDKTNEEEKDGSDMFEQLRKMQEELKQQVEKNHGLYVNTQIKPVNNIIPEISNNIDKEENEPTIQDDIIQKPIDKLNHQEEMEKTDEHNMQELLDKVKESKIQEESKDFGGMYQKIFGKLPYSAEKKEKNEENEPFNAYEIIKDNNISVFEETEEYKDKPNYKFIGIAFSTYIIIEIGQELYIIDQHAAHERIMYEKVKKNFYSQTDKDSQMLLLPDVITLTHKEWDIAHENKDVFAKAGFTIEDFGENTIKLTGVPNVCIDLNTSELFLETLDEINTVARTAKQEIEEKFIATVACKAAVKANMSLEKEEVEKLMNDLLKLPNPFTCPHGRPTAIKMEKTDIEKKFARRK